MTRRPNIRRCAIVLALCQSCLTEAQIRQVTPAKVIDMRTVTPGLLGETCTRIDAVVTLGPRWAALLTCPGNNSVIVWGDRTAMHTAVLRGRFLRMAMDAGYNIALTSYPVAALASAGVTKVTVLDADGHLSKPRALMRPYAQPFMAAGQIRWATDAGVFKEDELSADSKSAARMSKAPWVAPPGGDHILFYSGLESGGFVTIGNLTESITEFDEQNHIIAVHPLHLDDAYRRIGLHFTPPDIANGITRMVWGSASRNGMYYIGLSERPMTGPEYVAGVDPLTGEVKDVISAALPTTPGRIRLPFDPVGVILPVFGAVDENMVLADPDMQILVVY